MLAPVNSFHKVIDRYRAVSSVVTSVLAAIAAFVLASILGFLGAVAATYLYDRGNSRGNDLAVGLGGLFSVGTFTFVVAFTWLQKTHHSVSSRTSLFALCACLVLPALVTVVSADEMDYYSLFILGDWLAILVLGLLSLLLCRRWWQREEQGF